MGNRVLENWKSEVQSWRNHCPSLRFCLSTYKMRLTSWSLLSFQFQDSNSMKLSTNEYVQALQACLPCNLHHLPTFSFCWSSSLGHLSPDTVAAEGMNPPAICVWWQPFLVERPVGPTAAKPINKLTVRKIKYECLRSTANHGYQCPNIFPDPGAQAGRCTYPVPDSGDVLWIIMLIINQFGCSLVYGLEKKSESVFLSLALSKWP